MKKFIAILTTLALTLGALTCVLVGASASVTVATFEEVYVGEYDSGELSGVAHIVFGTVSDKESEYGIVVEDESGKRLLFKGKAIGDEGKFGIALYEVPDGNYVAYAYTGSGDNRVLGNGVAFSVGALYEREGDIVTIGERADKVVTDTALISALSKLTGDENGKIVYDGKAYFSFVASPYNDYFYANGNKIEAGEKYYFALTNMEWIVLSEDETSITMISKEIVLASPYHAEFEDVSYEDSTIKGVVEGLKSAYFTDEQEGIASAFTLPTVDQINGLVDKTAKLSDYAKATGADCEDLAGYENNGDYWLIDANHVDMNGMIMEHSNQIPVNSPFVGVRPVVTIEK